MSTFQVIGMGGQAIPVLMQGTCEIETVGASSVQSTAFDAATEVVRIVSTTDTWLSFGAAPTAAATGTASFILPANVVEYFAVPRGGTFKVAHLQVASGGTLTIMQGKAQS